MTATRRAFVRTYFDFEIREDRLPPPGEGEVLIEIAACAVCGTDLSIAGKTAKDWSSLGHEISGVIREVGPNVQRVQVGDRVALDTSAPCGTCDKCLQGRPVACRRPASYWGKTMGFADFMLAPWQLVFPVGGSLPAHHACLLEPMGVSLDMVDMAEVEAGSRVLIIGPGPLGLLAIPDCVRRGAARIWMAGRRHSTARMAAAETLGAALIHVDETPLDRYDWQGEAPDRVLVVAPPDQIPLAARICARSAVISYIGIAWDGKPVPFDLDHFHFKRLTLRSSMHGPATRSLDSLAILQSGCFDPDVVISEHFPLADLPDAMARNRDDKAHAKKLVMTRPEAGW